MVVGSRIMILEIFFDEPGNRGYTHALGNRWPVQWDGSGTADDGDETEGERR